MICKCIALASILVAIGCHKCPETRTIVVPCPEPPVVVRPELPIKQLKPEDSVNKERVLWVATVEVLDGYCTELEKLLDGYRKPKEEKKWLTKRLFPRSTASFAISGSRRR